MKKRHSQAFQFLGITVLIIAITLCSTSFTSLAKGKTKAISANKNIEIYSSTVYTAALSNAETVDALPNVEITATGTGSDSSTAKSDTGSSEAKPVESSGANSGSVNSEAKPESEKTETKPAAENSEAKPATDSPEAKPAAGNTETKPSTDNPEAKPASGSTEAKPASDSPEAKPATGNTESKPGTDNPEVKPVTENPASLPKPETSDSLPKTGNTDAPQNPETAKPVSNHGNVDIRSKADIPANLSGKTVIIQTNDIHGEMWSYQETAALKKDLKGRGADVILVDLGDFSSGTPNVDYSSGAEAITAMNGAGYDVGTIGNHEFDYGYDQLKNNLRAAAYIPLCANILDSEGRTILQPNMIINKGSGLSVGFFGLCTPETPVKLDESKTKGLNFLAGKELYACAQEQINLLKSQGANVIICLSHLGIDSNATPANSTSIDLNSNTRGINLILDSHSHVTMTSPVQSAGAQYECVGIVIIDNAKKKIEDHFLIRP